MRTWIETSARWVEDHYLFGREHLRQTLVWLDRLAPGSREAVRLAALTHDMERAFPGPDSPAMALHGVEYYRAHSARSVRIVGEYLRSQDAPEPLVIDVEALILVHEFGGWPEADLVQAADSVSFLEVNIDLFLGFARDGKFSVSDVRGKFQWMNDRIQVEAARPIAKPMLDDALARLRVVEAALAAAPRGRTA